MKKIINLNKDLVHAVDQLIIDTACYQPIELLLRLNLIAYADYEQWRMGKIYQLSDILSHNKKEIIHHLDEALFYVQSLNLIPEPMFMQQWTQDDSTKILKFCPDNSAFADKLTIQYIRQDDDDQMDLFFDNQSLSIVKELKQALISRNIKIASQQFQALYQTEPEHKFFQPAQLLLDALVNALEEEPISDTAEEMRYLLDELQPLAKKALSGQERDYMSLFWHRLADNIDNSHYDETQGDRHSSYCYEQIPDWQAVIKSITQTTDGQKYPELLARLALALNKSGQHKLFMQTLCQFFWRFSTALEETTDKAFIMTDAALKKSWYAFLDQELDVKSDEQWGEQNFPSWLLIKEPGISHYISVNEHTPEAFKLLQQLTLAELKNGAQAIELRKQLNQAQSNIFKFYLKSL
ncbi:MAG: hypothetical protein KZQ70_10245 [gamma proteobacterium symbiont of Lucinoma myriamae]|nr:hypothetical protein [gamma proteobacterium symbiont of Lucinoma myriamae]MCU7819232.1 hypothetical protein [gamma proteobacterium symbiont of Lucinoma myriamae]MCU7832718.1 hypothetical protein [gamma proteobacterium symbiont of Lucinoma myriamae]